MVIDSAVRYPNISFYSLNPGLIKSNIRVNDLGGTGRIRFRIIESLTSLMTGSTEKYTIRFISLMLSPDLENHSGAFFNRKMMPSLLRKAWMKSGFQNLLKLLRR